MPVQPNDDALTTTAAFFEYMGEPTDQDGTMADRAQRMINAYSSAAVRYMRRKLKPVENAADKKFYYTGNGFLTLAPFEARAINTVTLYTDMPSSDWMVLSNGDATQEAQWRVRPTNKTALGTYLYMTLPEIGPYHPYYDEPVTTLNRRNLGYEVTINGDWGVSATDMPDDVELAVWIAVANAWRNPEGYMRRQLGPLSASDYDDPATMEGLSLPRATRALLAPYRRKTGVR